MTAFKISDLVLGWKISKGMDPEYWLQPDAKPGSQDDKYLVRVAAPNIAYHTIVIAQSGSGKSFFLGRYLEEILLKTKSRIVVLDPNSDFRTLRDIVGPEKWDNASYDPIKRSGFLPHEKSRQLFERPWNKVSKDIVSARDTLDPGIISFRINWCQLSIEWVFADAPPALHNELNCCHRFVHNFCRILAISQPKIQRTELEFWTVLDQLLRSLYKKTREEAANEIKGQFPLSRRVSGESESTYEIAVQSASVDNELISAPIRDRYLNVANAQMRTGKVFFEATDATADSRARIQVFDLLSMADTGLQAAASSIIVDTEMVRARERWEAALKRESAKDRRTPTFIVVDEAHNFVSGDPQTEAQHQTREQFRTIAAEGRKFGLFLILVSQRPDKLDPWILSEFQNRALMKLGSRTVLDKACELLGFDRRATEMAELSLQFDAGRALIAGPWAGESPTMLYAAARRTIDGGRNLRERHWARPERKLERYPVIRSSLRDATS